MAARRSWVTAWIVAMAALGDTRSVANAPFRRLIHTSNRPCMRLHSTVEAATNVDEETTTDALAAAKKALDDVAGEILAKRERGKFPITGSIASKVKELTQKLKDAKDTSSSLTKLPGLWRLEYTTAPDVLSIFTVEQLPFSPIQIGKIYQRYGTPSLNDNGELQGSVENIVKLAVPPITEDKDGLTFVVNARYFQGKDDVSIAFETAGVEKLRVSALTEFLVAPPILPRLDSLRALARLSGASIRVPLVAPSSIATSAFRAAGKLDITYVDDDTLVAEALSGFFFFRREAE